MKIIPALDIINGKCVRLSKGDYNTVKVYNENPIEVAKQFEDSGIKNLHLVDLDGAKSGQIVNYNILAKIKHTTNLHVDFGGGLKSDRDLQIAFECGADQITGGSIAVDHPDTFLAWINCYGADKIILGADCVHRKIATHGWLKQADWDVVDYIKHYTQNGIEHVICTDIMKDGMLKGVSSELYKEIIRKVKINLIASGGVSCLEDIMELKQIGCGGVIIGKAIYEGRITLKTLERLC